ncbi:MAG: ACT domain-containing protein [Bacteroidia bacterium]
MRSISFDTDNGIFEGTIMVYVHSTEHLTQLINKLKKVNGVTNIVRLDS